jgi:hypothetical protein
VSSTGPYARIVVTPSPSAQPLWWRIADHEDGVDVMLGGDVDENADFSELRLKLHGHVRFDLAEVRRVNSCGVREWVNLHRDMVEDPPVTVLEYHACAPSVVAQLNTISNFRGPAQIKSFLAPYVCEACNREETRLIQVRGDPRATALPEFSCADCGRSLVFDDIPDRYLSFLAEL